MATGKKYVKGMDTMDVWFDSGSSWASVCSLVALLPLPFFRLGKCDEVKTAEFAGERRTPTGE